MNAIVSAFLVSQKFACRRKRLFSSPAIYGGVRRFRRISHDVKFKAPVFAGSKQLVEYELWIERGDETKIPACLEEMVSGVHVNSRLL